jgi:hypothetical protein
VVEDQAAAVAEQDLATVAGTARGSVLAVRLGDQRRPETGLFL